MRRALGFLVVLASVWACGGTVLVIPGDAGTDGGGSSSSGGSGSSSGGSSGGSGSSSGGSSGGSGGGSSSGSSGSSSSSGGNGRVPLNHRPDDSPCSTAPPPGNCNFGGSGGSGICSSDAQCADAGANARCVPFNGGPAGCSCTYDACFHDSDCTGETCACHGSPYLDGDGNRCVPGNCHVDHDCGPGGYCSPTYGSASCGTLVGYYCHTPQDQCIDDSDCSSGGGFQVCAFSTTNNRWECQMELLCQ